MLEHVYHRVPVTALAFWDKNVIFSGEGNRLQAYDVKRQQLLASLPVFQIQVIHGIVIAPGSSNLVLVWGGSLIATCYFDGYASLRSATIHKTIDWIMDLEFSPDGSLAAFVTAHNALGILKLQDLGTTDASNGGLINPVLPGSNCILYSAHIQWLSASKYLIASGTAFGDVIIWSATISDDVGGLYVSAQTYYTFSAHEGSVFGVQIYMKPQPRPSGGPSCLLATCSDDRTVRLWDVSSVEHEDGVITESQRPMQSQRITGFRTTSTTEEMAPKCIAKAMGHVSRVWQARFLRDNLKTDIGRQPQIRIMSFGEDASNITWSLQSLESPAETYSLVQTAVETAHSGKHIWSAALSTGDRFATGGADGAIAVRAVARQQTGTKEICCGLLGPEDSYRAFAFVDGSSLVATTNQGRVLLITTDASGSTSTRELSAPLSGLRGYSVVSSTPGLVFIAGAEGTVRLYARGDEGVHVVVETSRKIAGLYVCAHGNDRTVSSVSLLVASVGKATALLLDLNADEWSKCVHQRQLILPQGFIITSFVRVSSNDEVFVAIGARNGSIATYRFSHDGTKADVTYSALMMHTHAKEAVTSLRWVPQDSSSKLRGHLHSTGRDGTHAVHRFDSSEYDLEGELVHKNALPFGPNIECLAFAPGEHLRVWGFKSKQFVVYDATAQREIMRVECGGARGSWAFHPSEGGGTLLWTQGTKLYQRTQSELPYSLLNSGSHGREIKAVAISSSRQRLIATGSEDTDIKLSTFQQGHGFRCLQTLRKHTTGIQHLQWSRDSGFLFSSGGFEEFFVWRVRTAVDSVGVGVVCESAHPNNGTSDLRIMGFHAVAATTTEMGDVDTEVSMVYSDSTMKLWRYHDRIWTLVASGSYLTACLTQSFRLDAADGATFLTTATDGHIGLWNNNFAEGRLYWSIRHRIHQNAILTVETYILHDGSYLIITGGDDNGIGLTRVTKVGEMSTLLIPCAHAAAVTGLAIISRSGQQLLLVTTSIDQRVKLWRIGLNIDQPGIDGMDVKYLANVPTAVADVSSMALYDFGDEAVGVLVCGVGMDMWRLKSEGEGSEAISVSNH